MAGLWAIKTFRAKPETEYKLKEMKTLSGLSESEIIRLAIDGISVIREKPSKELMNALSRIENYEKSLRSIADKEEIDEGDKLTIDVCLTRINSLMNEIRKKYI